MMLKEKMELVREAREEILSLVQKAIDRGCSPESLECWSSVESSLRRLLSKFEDMNRRKKCCNCYRVRKVYRWCKNGPACRACVESVYEVYPEEAEEMFSTTK